MKSKIVFLLIAFLLISACSGIPTQKINPSWDDATKQAVTKGALKLGMTMEQVVASWGRPDSTMTSLSDVGTIVVWQYGTYHWTSKKRYLTFVNGKLTRVTQ